MEGRQVGIAGDHFHVKGKDCGVCLPGLILAPHLLVLGSQTSL